MDMGLLMAFLVGLLLGALVVYLVAMNKYRNLREKNYQQAIQQVRLEEEVRASREQADKMQDFLNQSLKDMALRFKGLSNDVLEESRQRFIADAQTSWERQEKDQQRDLTERTKRIDDLLRPMHEKLESVEALMQLLERSRISSGASIQQQMQAMIEGQTNLKKETENLVRALRTPQGRGRWGEIQLRRVVELAGMLSHCDFEEQVNVDTEDGRLRPDMIINLPGDKRIVVDAKTPLQAYLEAVETDDELLGAQKLLDHARQVRSHINQLSQKSYWQQFEDTPEFVVMFLPGESFFSAALDKMPDLIEYGMARQVILATPTTLIALLKSAAYGWQQLQMTENAREIAELGRTLYDRIQVFSAHFEELEKNLNKTVVSYNKAVVSFDKRLGPAARRFESCGITSDKKIEGLSSIDTKAINSVLNNID